MQNLVDKDVLWEVYFVYVLFKNMELFLGEAVLRLNASLPKCLCMWIYDLISIEIKSIDDGDTFKKKLKEHLLKKPYYSLEEFYDE